MIDINCDLGEGAGNDAALMPYLSTCNIACGGHAGDAQTIDSAIQLAVEHDVLIGAHPSFPDRKNFGRQVLQMPAKDLRDAILCQLELFRDRAKVAGVAVNHVKAHGSLYGVVANQLEAATLFVDAVSSIFKGVKVFGPPQSLLSSLAPKSGLVFVDEAFADRNYNADLSLVSRESNQAVLTQSLDVLMHLESMVFESRVTTLDGKAKLIRAETFCIHGDNPNALPILQAIHSHPRLGHGLFELTFKPFGESAILMEWPRRIETAISDDIRVCQRELTECVGIRDCVAGYHSLLVQYVEPIQYEQELDRLQKLVSKRARAASQADSKLWQIPVCYDAKFGVDLEEIAATNQLPIPDVIQQHHASDYPVHFIGFRPGFLYLGGLNASIHMPRRAKPRLRVEQGMVAIGGEQTGVYPSAGPGGWNLIGKTPIRFFDAQSNTPCFAQPGDRIRFVPIDLDTFYEIEFQVERGEYLMRPVS